MLCEICKQEKKIDSILPLQDSRVCNYCAKVLEDLFIVKCTICGTVTDLDPNRHNCLLFMRKLAEKGLMHQIEYMSPGFVIWATICPNCKTKSDS